MDDVVRMSGALEPRGGWEATRCSIAKALEVVGTRSAFLLLREAFYGTKRFDDFVARTGTSQAVAASRLRELVDAGLLMKEPYKVDGERTREHYRVTDQGADLLPVLVGLMQWGDRWVNDGGAVGLRHARCGGSVRADIRCEHGHGVGAGELELTLRR